MNFSPEKIFIVGIIALLVLGPHRLPHAARTAGRMLAELRRLSASVQNELTNAIAEPRDALNQAVGEYGLSDVRSGLSEVHSTLSDVRGTLRKTVSDVVNASVEAPNDLSVGRAAQSGTGGAASALQGAVGSPADASASTEPAIDAPLTAALMSGFPTTPDDPSLN